MAHGCVQTFLGRSLPVLAPLDRELGTPAIQDRKRSIAETACKFFWMRTLQLLERRRVSLEQKDSDGVRALILDSQKHASLYD